MGTRIYVGNLSTRVTEGDLEDEVHPFLSFHPQPFFPVQKVWMRP